MKPRLRILKSDSRRSRPRDRSPHRWRPVRRVALSAVAIATFNLLCHCLLPAQIDLTHRGDFTLASQTRNLLASFDAPVEIVVLAPRVPRTAGEQNFHGAAILFRELIETCRQVQPLLRLEEFDPAESAAARRWQEQYPDVSPPCVLIVAGSGPRAGHEVLTARDLAEFVPADAAQGSHVEFFGEQALTAALSRLNSGRKQALLYATTGHGELSLDDDAPDSGRGLGLLAQMLRQLDCRIESLDLAAESRVPHDATLVVVAGGEKPWSAVEADKLGTYLRQGGRALVLADLHYDSRLKRPAPSGLEGLLSQFGVALGNDRVVERNFAGRVETAASALPAAGDHPLVRSLPQAPLTLLECRRLSLSTSARQLPVHIVPLLVSHAAPRAWADGDFGTSTRPLEPGGRNDTDGPVAMALAVERQHEREAAPVLVIAGDATFASNRVLSSPSGRVNSSFLLSSVNWLRGRRELLGDIPPQRHESVRLAGSPDDHRGLVWKSSLVLCALISTAGLTVWTTRRIG